MRFIMMIFYLCLMLLGVSFSVLNAGAVTLNLYFKTVTLPMSMLVVMAFVLGVLVGFVIFWSRYWCRYVKYRKVKHQLEMMEREIKNLREIPLKH
ncbi:MAG: LapA family protein [Legionellaceae bacterium]|nr:LapA family protein [Legionellaceae bacterium]